MAWVGPYLLVRGVAIIPSRSVAVAKAGSGSKPGPLENLAARRTARGVHASIRRPAVGSGSRQTCATGCWVVARRGKKIPTAGSTDHGAVDWREEDAEFHRAMAGLSSIPDKDGVEAGGDRSQGPPSGAGGRSRDKAPGKRSPSGRRKRASAVCELRRQSTLDKLDLHGTTAEQAVRNLDSFVQRARASGRLKVLVVTGKGRRSENGVPVVRNAVIRWLERTGRSRVERFESAPRRLGGTGALILTLVPVGRRRLGTRS